MTNAQGLFRVAFQHILNGACQGGEEPGQVHFYMHGIAHDRNFPRHRLTESGVTNWPPAAYSPETGLFYIPEHNGFNLLYLTDPDGYGLCFQWPVTKEGQERWAKDYGLESKAPA